MIPKIIFDMKNIRSHVQVLIEMTAKERETERRGACELVCAFAFVRSDFAREKPSYLINKTS